MIFIHKTLPALCITTSAAFAGARIDLRPQPNVPLGGYLPHSVVHIDVVLVDTGNPQGDIPIRGMVLDFEDSTDNVNFPGLDGLLGNSDDNQFAWNNPFGVAAIFPSLPITSYVWPLGPLPGIQARLPDGGEWWMGHIEVRLQTTSAIVDVMNSDEMDMLHGAQVAGGYGGAGDPVFTWRAFTSDLTGGVLELPVIPEPASLLLLSSAAVYIGLFRKGRLAQCRHAAM